MKRRRFLTGCSALGAAAVVSGCEDVKELNLREILGFPEGGETMSQIERNKAIALRYKNAQAEKDGEAIISRLLAPGYRRTRASLEHLAKNAEGQGHPGPGPYLRNAFPDRADVVEEVIAEGNVVGLLFCVTGTHQDNLFGIPATGRKVSFHEVAILRISGDWISNSWFMADEAGLLKQLGAKLPPRKDGQRAVPAVTGGGGDPDVVVKRIRSGPLVTKEDRNRLVVAQSKSSNPPKDSAHRITSSCGRISSICAITATRTKWGRSARRSRCPIARTASMASSRKATRCGCSPGSPASQGEPLRTSADWPPRGSARDRHRAFRGRKVEGWYFGDELGLMLQLGALHMLG